MHPSSTYLTPPPLQTDRNDVLHKGITEPKMMTWRSARSSPHGPSDFHWWFSSGLQVSQGREHRWWSVTRLPCTSDVPPGCSTHILGAVYPVEEHLALPVLLHTVCRANTTTRLEHNTAHSRVRTYVDQEKESLRCRTRSSLSHCCSTTAASHQSPSFT